MASRAAVVTLSNIYIVALRTTEVTPISSHSSTARASPAQPPSFYSVLDLITIGTQPEVTLRASAISSPQWHPYLIQSMNSRGICHITQMASGCGQTIRACAGIQPAPSPFEGHRFLQWSDVSVSHVISIDSCDACPCWKTFITQHSFPFPSSHLSLSSSWICLRQIPVQSAIPISWPLVTNARKHRAYS